MKVKTLICAALIMIGMKLSDSVIVMNYEKE